MSEKEKKPAIPPTAATAPSQAGSPVGSKAEPKKPPQAPLLAPLPEEEARLKVTSLQENIRTLEKDIKTLEGKLANNNPAEIAEIQAENNVLQNRLERLEKALYGLITETYNGRQSDDLKIKCEVLREAAIDYFKFAKIKNEIWKSIES